MVARWKVLYFGCFLWITHVTLFFQPSRGHVCPFQKCHRRIRDSHPSARCGAFVRLSLSSVTLLTGTHWGFLSDHILSKVLDACPLEWAPSCSYWFEEILLHKAQVRQALCQTLWHAWQCQTTCHTPKKGSDISDSVKQSVTNLRKG